MQQRREQKRQRAARHEAMVEAQRREAADAHARVDAGEGMDPKTANQIRLGKFTEQHVDDGKVGATVSLTRGCRIHNT